MSNYIPTIGIEVHAELKTKTKMFSRALNNPDETRPNVNSDPVTMAHPGTLPVINKKAVEHMINIGLALGGTIADFTEFDRKNYFYPDIPKGYQISQYKYPIVKGGVLEGVKITKVHLEEDTGTNKHLAGASLVDYNRAGVPLMEMVTEPVLHSSVEAGNFGRGLQQLLRFLGASDANMEKGEMRVELNISIADVGMDLDSFKALYETDSEKYMSLLGTKVEVKNINSFRAAEKAAEYEIERMTALLDAGRGDEIVQETRGWDDAKGQTFSQRAKEDSHDYRYFPDPDLPKLYLSQLFDIPKMKSELVELPWEKRTRYETGYGISGEAIDIFLDDKELAVFFEKAIEDMTEKAMMQTTANYLTSDFMGMKKENPELALPDVGNFKTLMKMIAEAKINSRGAKDILKILVTEGGDPEKIADERGLIQKNDTETLRTIAQQVIDENKTVADEYRNGKEISIKFLIGQGMKLSKGSANPQLLEEILKEVLK